MTHLSCPSRLVTVESIAVGGRGVARLADGRPLFVRGAFVGDVIEPVEVRDRRGYAETDQFRLQSAAPDRVQPACPAQATCGGCDFMPVDLKAQLEAKRSMIVQALERVGKLDLRGVPVVMQSSPQPLRYRSRVRLQVKGGRLGFFSRQTHHLVEVDDCIVSSGPLWAVVERVRRVVKKSPRAFEPIAHAEIRVLGSAPPTSPTASVSFTFHPGQRRTRQKTEELQRAVADLRPAMAVSLAPGDVPAQSFTSVNGREVPAPVGGFTQVNEGTNHLLVQRVLQLAKKMQVESFLDLYCGSGNFSLPLAHQGMRGVGVEQARVAIAAAQDAARKAALRVDFVSRSCADYLKEAVEDERDFDLVLLDPPRAGARACVSHLLKMSPRFIVFVSCDPASLGRDLRAIVQGGYVLRGVEGFDMFPQTHHVETLAILQRDEIPRLSFEAS